jgi:hypothetical protein
MKKLVLALTFLVYGISYGQQACAPKMVFLEQTCGKDCGPCWTHIVREIQPLYAKHRDKIAYVVYNQAPIGIAKLYSEFYSAFSVQFQSAATIDRTYFPTNYDDNGGGANPLTFENVKDAEKGYNEQMASKYVPVKVTINHTYDVATRKVDIKVTANFCDTASGNLAIYVVLVQDTVKGPSNTYAYAQNAGSAGNVGDVVDGYKLVSFPSSGGGSYIAAPSFTFVCPVKYQPTGFFGNTGIIPSKPVLNTDYSEIFSFTLPVKNDPAKELLDIEPKRIQILAAVVKKGNFKSRQVLNANKVDLIQTSTSVHDSNLSDIDFMVTNPSNESVALSYSSSKMGKADIYIYNAMGEVVRTLPGIEYSPIQKVRTIPVSDLGNGIYFISLKTESGLFHTRKAVIHH